MANKIYTATETAVQFKSGAGAAVVGFSPMSLPNGSGRQSHPRDFGSASHATTFRWRAKTKCDTAPPTVGGAVELYWAGFEETADGGAPVNVDGNLGSGDASVTDQEHLRNLQYLGAITVDMAATGVAFVAGGVCQLPARYGQVVWWNRTGTALTSASGDHQFDLYPWPTELQ
jgi:hypothetical protein